MNGFRLRSRKAGITGGIAALALAGGLAGGCSLESPTAPSWEVVLNLPLFNEWLDLSDLFDASLFVPVGSDSVYAIDFDQSLDRIEVGDQITFDGIDEMVSRQIGTFTVPAQETQNTSLSLFTAYPALSAFIGVGSVTIPAFTFPPVRSDIPAFGSFSRVTIASGTVTVRLTNNTRIPYDQLEVRLLDQTTTPPDAVVLSIDMIGTNGDLIDGEMRTVVQPLDGLAVGSDLTLEILGHSNGDTTVALDGSEGFDIQVEFSNLVVDSATAVIDPIDFVFSDSITFTDAARIQSAALSGGTVTLELDNQLPIPLQLTVQLPELRDPFDTPVGLNLIAPAATLASDVRDLTDHTLTPTPVGPDTLVLSVNVTVHSDGSGGSQVTLASSDSVAIRAAVAGLVVRAVSGVLDPTGVTIDPDSLQIDDTGNLLDELRKINLTAIDLELEIRSTIDFPAQVNLSLVGVGGIPDPVPVDLGFYLPASGPGGAPDTTVITFNETNTPELLTFLNAVPTTIRFSGSASIGDDAYVGSVTSASYLEVDVRFRMPVILDVTQPINIEIDKEENQNGVGGGNEQKIRFQEATLTYQISSTMGLPLTARWVVATDSLDVYTNPQIEIPLTIYASKSAAVDTTITITRAQWDILQAPHWMGAKITIPPTTSPARLAKNDRVWLKAFLTVRARIDLEAGSGGGGDR